MREDIPEFLIQYFDYKSAIQNKSEKTIQAYYYDLKNFFQFLIYRFNKNTIPKEQLEKIKKTQSLYDLDDVDLIKELDISELNKTILTKITLHDLHAFLQYSKSELKNGPHILTRKASSIRAFFKYITTIDGYLKENPASSLESPKIPKTLPKYLDLEESKKLIQVASQPTSKRGEKYASRNKAIIVLFLNCGIRLAELIGIDIPDINLNEGKMRITGKGSKERQIFLNSACIRAIKDYLDTRPDDAKGKHKNALFLSNQKKRISRRSVQYIVENELKKAGIDSTKYSPHKLRHTAATLMYQYGDVDIAALQKVLGHESVATTEIYTHAENYEIKRAIENNPLSNLE